MGLTRFIRCRLMTGDRVVCRLWIFVPDKTGQVTAADADALP